MGWNSFSKTRIRSTLPVAPSDSQLRLYTGSTGTTLVQNDDDTYPYIKKERVGDLAIDESVSVTAETYRATLIVDAEPSTSEQWWFSKDCGTTKERVKVIARQMGMQGYYYSLIFQLQG